MFRLKSDQLFTQIRGMLLLTILGQGLYVAASPFISRIYSPEEVGYFGLFFSIWTILASFACGLYDLAIPAVADDDEARKLSGVSVVIGSTVSILAGGGLYIAAANDWFGLGVFPWWIGLGMTATMLTQIVVLIGQAWAMRRSEIMVIGQSNVLMNGFRGIAQVAGGLVMPTWAVLAAGEGVARLAQARYLAYHSKNKVTSHLQFSTLGETIVKHVKYPIVFGPSLAIDAFSSFLQTAMVGLLFGPAQMGQYFMMRRTLDLPVAFVFKSLSDLFFVKLLALSREDPARLRNFFLRSFLLLAAAGLVAGAPLIIWGRMLFELFYGVEWGEAGLLAALMAPAMILNLAVAPVARIFQLSPKVHLRLLPSAFNFVGTVIAVWFCQMYAPSFHIVVGLISAVTCFYYIVYFAAGYFVAGHTTVENTKFTDQKSAAEYMQMES